MHSITRQFKKLAGKALHDYRMIEDGDRILLGVSGGKDSVALVKFLEEHRSRVPIDYSLVAVHLDLGYDNPAEKESLKNYLKELDVEFHFEDKDYAIVAHSEVNRENPCFLCASHRRRRLFELARDFDCCKLALGHNRDDLIETLLLNIFYSGEISTMIPAQKFFGGALTIIRPLAMVPEAVIHRLVERLGLPAVENQCPTSGQSKRKEVKTIIANLSRKNDKVPANIFRALSNYRPDYLLGRPET
ncbi:MAG: tRNA 2-thiocytidine(32) synthetase TtcA [Deltaproteobacteria bacterium]|nr:tRNA 2-thiocytidine(32) synthetase TtcA [Deltaproteobacteria bacterium]MBW2053850.1 tRNA 2-thiocytidine(32) synthetase TtcA [Deltaproteobacteria bacterium]MBW2142304.1 tRNA 2-thiocytidine(32) synthetase TtcA [Deltaproteobacteria bacterium]MBW2324309.1 tRNA 2-thiocytidine(32) synthetase TtcA [Deltaproteobacteria bacterium]